MSRTGIALIVIGVLIAITLLSVIGWAVSVATGTVKKVVNPDSIVYNYEWFYDQYNAIEASRAKLKIAELNLAKSSPGTESYDRRSTEVAGIGMVLQGMIAEYNSKSSQITRNLWKAGDLPYRIEEGQE